MSSFILVHGAWGGGWMWRRVADRLIAAGHRVFCPTLTGLGERSHLASPQVTLETHIADIANLILWEELENAVLVGHSYAGFVISGVAEIVSSATLDAVVYLDAFLPADGTCVADYVPVPSDASGELPDWLVPPIPAAPPRSHAPDCDWLNRLRSPQPRATFTQSVRITGAFERVPRKVYVLATGYPSPFVRFAEPLRARPGWQVHEIISGHDLMLSHPEEIAALLLAAAAKGDAQCRHYFSASRPRNPDSGNGEKTWQAQ